MNDLVESLEATVKQLEQTGFKARYGFGATNLSLTIGPYVLIERNLVSTVGESADLMFTREFMVQVLREFYRKDIPKDLDAMLVLRRIGAIGDFLLTNMGADVVDLLPEDAQADKYEGFAREFGDLSRFIGDMNYRLT